jgi:3-oxoacyl-[acyl-carrier-protein] synthase II
VSEPTVIVRSAALSALGNGLPETVAAIAADRCGVRAMSALEQPTRSTAGAGEIDLGPQAAQADDRAEILLRRGLEALLGADAAATLSTPVERVAIVVGTTLAGMRHCGRALRAEAAGDVDAAFRSYIATPAGSVLRKAIGDLPVGGIRVSVSCACASALSAIAHGRALLESGEADAVIAGGYDPIAEFVFGGFSALQLVASGPLSPFAADREGMKLGEGCALFLLRRASESRARGETPIATIEAIGESSDAHHLTQPHPEGRGAAAALRQAIGPGVPGLLLAHATGTPGNDGAEYAAYRDALGDRLRSVPVAALKSRFGHPLGAAGALELAIGLACADHGVFPSGTGRPPDREGFPDLDLVHGPVRPGRPDRITALAAGFGGANVAISVVCRETPVAVDSNVRTQVAIAGWGAVSGGGRGIDGLRQLGWGGRPAVDEHVLAGLLDRARTRRLALLPRLLLAAVRDLLETSGLDAAELRDIPVLAATWHGAVDFTDRYYRDLIAQGVDLANPLLFAESVPNVGSGHLSLGYGIAAASASVIGTRTAGFEALGLAAARIRSGRWSRALIVAADEVHPTVATVLSRCAGRPVEPHAGAVALLVDGVGGGYAPTSLDVRPERVAGAIGSASPFDRATGPVASGLVLPPELGAATGPATLMLLHAGDVAGGGRTVATLDPNGAAWSVRLGSVTAC